MPKKSILKLAVCFLFRNWCRDSNLGRCVAPDFSSVLAWKFHLYRGTQFCWDVRSVDNRDRVHSYCLSMAYTTDSVQSVYLFCVCIVWMYILLCHAELSAENSASSIGSRHSGREQSAVTLRSESPNVWLWKCIRYMFSCVVDQVSCNVAIDVYSINVRHEKLRKARLIISILEMKILVEIFLLT